MNSEDNKLSVYKENNKRDGEDLVLNVFPKRVFEMDSLLQNELFSLDRVIEDINISIPYPTANNSIEDMDIGTTDSNHKGSIVYALPYGRVSFNKKIKVMIDKTKPCLTKLMSEAQLVRLWIQFSIPRIEDGNNFGVGIQEEVLSEASGIERDACTFLDQITRYFASRGKLVCKVAKYPHIDDYRQCIRDMDEKQAITMRYIIMEIRNHYATLHDIIIKNLDRIKTPRSNNAVTMY